MVLALAGSSIQLVPDGTLLFHLILILGMVAVLNRTLLRPINRILEERDRRTSGRLAEARQILASVDEKISHYETALRAARARGYELADDTRKAASADREVRISAVKTEIGDWLVKEKANLRAEQEDVKMNLAQGAQDRAKEISSQILGRPL